MLLQQKQNEQFYVDHRVPVATWAMGLIQRSDTGMLNTVLGREARTPGEYRVIDPKTGKPTDKRLTNTCEFVHPCVRYRMQQKGPGIANSAKDPPQGTYNPKALAGWKYISRNQPWRDDKTLGIGEEAEHWDEYGKWMIKRKDGSSTFIVEETMEKGMQEMELLQAWPGVPQKVLD